MLGMEALLGSRLLSCGLWKNVSREEQVIAQHLNTEGTELLLGVGQQWVVVRLP